MRHKGSIPFSEYCDAAGFVFLRHCRPSGEGNVEQSEVTICGGPSKTLKYVLLVNVELDSGVQQQRLLTKNKGRVGFALSWVDSVK